ncbi:MAG: hypothetical protein H6807_17125 [Planctomycetes bacterium]|nr:hypothetical protein [Planctomycetota bacterium]
MYRTSIVVALGVVLLASVLTAQAGNEAGGMPKRSPRQWNCIGDPADLPAGDPARGEIPLEGAAAGWNAFHLYTSETWRLHTIGAGLLSRANGSPQVVVMDEEGRTIILQGDSGKWAPHVVVQDEASMSAWAAGELDPRLPGAQIYLGGRSGRIFRVGTKGRGFVAEEIARIEGSSLSQFVLGEIDPARPGPELLIVTNDGPVFMALPEPGTVGSLAIERVCDLGTRCRDAVLLPGRGGKPPRVAALLQTGEVTLLSFVGSEPKREILCDEPMSIARLARRRVAEGEPEVVYVARVDGLILRFEEKREGGWERRPIYAGPSGPRGLAAGRFDADARTETVAVFGYSKKVQLLRRPPGASWQVETLFMDGGGGHWLTAAELDGRNATDELVAGGFGYHVFMLTRQPGQGLDGLAIDPDGGLPDYPIPGLDPIPDAATGPARAAALMERDFDQDQPGLPPPGFEVVETRGQGRPAAWEVTREAPGRGLVRMTRNENAGGTFNLLLADAACPADLRLEVAVRAESGKEDQGGGPVWRARDADNYYLARWNPLEKNLRVYKVEGGKRTMFAGCYLDCDSLSWHRISIGMRGRRGVVGFDGQECLVFEDQTFTEGGRVGFWTKADAATSFDDLIVRPLED